MKKIKILFVASEYATGMIPFASTIINILSKDDRFDIRAVTVNTNKYCYRNKIFNESAVYITYPQKKWKKALYKVWPYSIIKEIEKCKREFHPDFIHLLTGDITLALYVSLTSNKRYVWTIHDLQMHSGFKFYTNYKLFLLQFYQPITYKLFLKHVRFLTTSSLDQYNTLLSMYKDKKTYYTHFPSLITNEIQNGSDIPKELTNIENYILFFGVDGSYKGVDLLLKAFVKSNFSKNAYLVIAGKGHTSYNEEKHPFVIRLNRYFSDSELKSLFSRSCLVVYPYRTATMSGVLSIAYYFNCRLLVSNIPYFMQNKADGVEVFIADNEENLLNKLNYIYSNLHSIRTDEEAYKKFYSEDTIAYDYYVMYNDLIKTNKNGR